MSIAIFREDGLASSTAIKGPCKAATTANITLSGEQNVDGVAVVEGDRVLVKDQTAATENGLYVVDTGNWRRSADFEGNRDVRKGTQVYVTDGTGFGWYRVETDDPVVIDTSEVEFQFTERGDPVLPQTNASSSAPASIDLAEDTANGSNRIRLQAPSALAANRDVVLPDADDTLVGKATTDTLTNKSLVDSSTYIVDNADPTKRMQFQASGITTGQTRVFTVPDADETLVGRATTDTLTNKSISGSSNTLTNIPAAQLTGTVADARLSAAMQNLLAPTAWSLGSTIMGYRNVNTAASNGDTMAGSEIEPCNSDDVPSTGSALSGTARCCGQITTGSGDQRVTNFVRIA